MMVGENLVIVGLRDQNITESHRKSPMHSWSNGDGGTGMVNGNGKGHDYPDDAGTLDPFRPNGDGVGFSCQGVL
jgi:hypothetical protein